MSYYRKFYSFIILLMSTTPTHAQDISFTDVENDPLWFTIIQTLFLVYCVLIGLNLTKYKPEQKTRQVYLGIGVLGLVLTVIVKIL